MLDLEYRKDPDLDFLEFVPGYELADLVKILTTNGVNEKCQTVNTCTRRC